MTSINRPIISSYIDYTKGCVTANMPCKNENEFTDADRQFMKETVPKILANCMKDLKSHNGILKFQQIPEYEQGLHDYAEFALNNHEDSERLIVNEFISFAQLVVMNNPGYITLIQNFKIEAYVPLEKPGYVLVASAHIPGYHAAKLAQVERQSKTSGTLQQVGCATTVPTKHRYVAVFGSARNLTDADESWKQARKLGSGLAKKKYHIVSGGYTGIMEAVFQGAREHDGKTFGVILPQVFHDRPTANQYTTRVIDGGTSEMQRVDKQWSLASNFVVFEGSMGTFHELHSMLVTAAIRRIQEPDEPNPIRLFVKRGGQIEQAIRSVVSIVHRDKQDIELITFFDDVQEVVDALPVLKNIFEF